MKISEKQIQTLIRVAQAYVDTLKQITSFECDLAIKGTQVLSQHIHDQHSDLPKDGE